VWNLLPSPRILPAAGGASLAALLALSSVTTASSVPTFGYALNTDTLSASVTGDSRTGVWRIRVLAPSGDRRIDFILRSGDIEWSSAVRVSRKVDGVWTLVSLRSLDEALATGVSTSGCNAGVCWDSARFRLPRNGDARFGVTVRLVRSGDYRITGAVREASDAFVYGAWLHSASQSISH
jgi:hypothetical protein